MQCICIHCITVTRLTSQLLKRITDRLGSPWKSRNKSDNYWNAKFGRCWICWRCCASWKYIVSLKGLQSAQKPLQPMSVSLVPRKINPTICDKFQGIRGRRNTSHLGWDEEVILDASGKIPWFLRKVATKLKQDRWIHISSNYNFEIAPFPSIFWSIHSYNSYNPMGKYLHSACTAYHHLPTALHSSPLGFGIPCRVSKASKSRNLQVWCRQEGFPRHSVTKERTDPRVQGQRYDWLLS